MRVVYADGGGEGGVYVMNPNTTCLVVGADGVVRHGPCTPEITPEVTPVITPVLVASPPQSETAVITTQQQPEQLNLLPFILAGFVLYLLTK